MRGFKALNGKTNRNILIFNTIQHSKVRNLLSAKGNEGGNEENVEKLWGKLRFFVKKQVETDVFEGQERDGRRRGRKDGGRTEGGQREDVPRL